MKKLYGVILLTVSLIFSNIAFSEPYKSSDFPPNSIIEKAYDQFEKKITIKFLKTADEKWDPKTPHPKTGWKMDDLSYRIMKVIGKREISKDQYSYVCETALFIKDRLQDSPKRRELILTRYDNGTWELKPKGWPEVDKPEVLEQ